MNTLYTIGYTGWKPEALHARVSDLGAMLLDIRYSPNSRVPHWRREALRERFGEGNYLHVPALGNRNYANGGPIELAAPEKAVNLVRICLARRPAVLLCACAEVDHCHRWNAATYMENVLGCEVEHLVRVVL